ncbi:MAG: DNA alkylation repair protein [Bacteroidales bacterium]
MEEVLEALRDDLKKSANPEYKKSGERFFREKVTLYGIRSSEVQALSKKHFNLLPVKTKAIVFGLCENLWASGMLEESFVACNWSYSVKKQYTRDDFQIFADWVSNHVTNWASCDTLCNHNLGLLLERFPDLVNELTTWTASGNRWVKRGSAVSLIIPARKGMFLPEIFNIAERLLMDKDDMVQKGYGWMLKAASQAHLDEVYNFVTERKSVMPRTAYRYAIEKMPPVMRAKAMEK